jgi:hypothetical protein
MGRNGTRWRRSSYSGGGGEGGGNCVELAHTLDRLRDSKNPTGAVLNADCVSLLRWLRTRPA